jgi:hypothetical protein
MTALQSSSLTDQEIQSIETLYRAFNDRNPDLLDEVFTADWEDIPLAPGPGPWPRRIEKAVADVRASLPRPQGRHS